MPPKSLNTWPNVQSGESVDYLFGRVSSGNPRRIPFATLTYNALLAGATGDGTIDDSATLNTLAQTISDAGGGTLYIPRPSAYYYLGTTTLLIPAVVNLVLEPGAFFLYDGDDIGIHVTSGATGVVYRHGRYDIAISRKYTPAQIQASHPALDWTDGTDQSSVGVRFTNIRESNINIQDIENFYIGLQPCGDGTGTVNNVFNIGFIRNNRNQISPLRLNGGWNNQNTYIGGSLPIDSYYTGVDVNYPTLLVDMTTENNNLFLNVNLEGGATTPSLAVSDNTSFNAYINCRYEGQGAGTFHIGSSCTSILVDGGYLNYGPDSALFDINSKYVSIRGVRGALFVGDNGAFGGPAVIGKTVGGGGALAFQSREDNDVVFFEVVAGSGNILLYDAGGKAAVSYPSITINAANSSIDFGDTAGSTSPTAAFRAHGTTLDYQNKLHQITATARRGIAWVSLSNGVTSINLSAGAGFLTQGTTAIATLSGGTDGQEFFIKAGASGATITAGSSFKTKSGSDITLAAGQVAKFMAISSSIAWEI